MLSPFVTKSICYHWMNVNVLLIYETSYLQHIILRSGKLLAGKRVSHITFTCVHVCLHNVSIRRL